MGFLENVYLGNTLQNWLTAACLLVGVFTVLKIIQRIVISRLSKLAAATDNQIDDLIVSMLRQTKFLILLLASAYVAFQAITLKPAIAALWQIVSEIIEKQENARLDRVHFKEYGDSSLNFEVVYFVAKPDFNLYMDVQEAINLEIFRRFQEEGIEFAYPTQTLYIQRENAKL